MWQLTFLWITPYTSHGDAQSLVVELLNVADGPTQVKIGMYINSIALHGTASIERSTFYINCRSENRYGLAITL